MSIKINQANKKPQRPTIGLFIDTTAFGYEQAVWSGVVDQARIEDVNLVTFNVTSQSMGPSGRQFTQIVDLINNENLQGLIINAATTFDIVPLESLSSFVERFQPLPMVSMGVEIPEIPSLILDNYQGMRSVIDHLIEDHEYRRIAYLEMFGENLEAKERFRAYTESLADHHIHLDYDLIVPGEYFGRPEETVALLLDERKVEFDALVSVNDEIALMVLPLLRARGIQVPGEIALAGFDDLENSRYSSPPLTTARQPISDMGRKAVQYIVAQINGEEVPALENVQTELMVRQSCGCINPDVTRASISETDETGIKGIPGLVAIKEEIVAKVLEAAGTEEQNEQIIGQVLDAYFEALSEGSPVQFLQQLTLATETLSGGGIIGFNWQAAISTLRYYSVRAVQSNDFRFLVENLLQQARTLVAEIAMRVQANQRLAVEAEATTLRIFSEQLSIATNRQSLFALLADHLPRLGIPGCLLVLNKQLQSNDDQKYLLFVFNSEEHFDIPEEGVLLQPGELPPAKYLPSKQQYNFVTESLEIQDQERGFVLFEASSSNGALYVSLADQISSALQNVDLIEQVANRANQLSASAEISRAASSILDPKELMAKAVDLIKEHFDLYYVGLFLLAEDQKWAELRAGTGEAGADMLAENWRLEVGGGSMIGQCIVKYEADIQLDVDKAPIHLRNPHLPNTKSEMALPLLSRGAVMGALSIQSTIANAFSLDDIATLQTMADQIAISIANAQLFERTQTALLDTEALLNISRLASTAVDFEPYAQQALDLTLKSIGIEAGLLSIFNTSTNRLELTAHLIPESYLNTLQTNGLEGTLCDLVYQQKEAVIVYDLAHNSPLDATGLTNLGFTSYQGVPLETKGQVYGTLCTFSESRLRPEDSSIALLQAIGQQLAVSIENTRLFEQTQEALAETENQSERLAALNELSEKLGQTQTLDEIYQVGASVLTQIITADRSSFALVKDDGKTAELLTVSGEDGVAPPTGSLIPLDGNAISRAIETKRSVIENRMQENIEPDDEFARLGLKCFLIIPLIVRNEVIGTFNFVAKTYDSFSERDRDLGVQLASLMGNAIENQNLIQQTQEALAELEATQRRYQLQAWSSYNQSRSASGYQRTPLGVEPIGRRATPETQKAIAEQSPLVSGDDDNLKLTIPIMLRDQPIGAIGLQAKEGKRNWNPDEIALAQEISEQFALAAESLRLLDETQRRAARERLVAEITTKIRANTDPQTMLQTAAKELQKALKSKRTQVLLQGNAHDKNEQGQAKRGEQ